MDLTNVNLAVQPGSTFTIKCPQDEEENGITGIISLASRLVVVADNQNNALKLFESDGTYISSVEDPQFTMGITEMTGDDFATCGYDREIFLWTVRDQDIIQLDTGYEVDHDADGIRFNGEYFAILHRFDNAVTVLDNKGSHVNKIVVKEAFERRVNFGFGIQMDRGNNIYIPCTEESKGVLCLSIDGALLWHCELPGHLGGLTLIGTILCVVDTEAKGVYMVDTTSGVFLRQLLLKSDFKGEPSTICYGESSGNVYVTFNVWSLLKDKVAIFEII